MSRDPRLYLEAIVHACEKVERYTAGLDIDAFLGDERTYDAVLRNLEVIGEAAKRVPPDIRSEISGVPWRAIAGFRDFVAHVYFALDDAIVWNAVRHLGAPHDSEKEGREAKHPKEFKQAGGARE